MYAQRGLFTAKVNWTEPVATDNLGAKPLVTSNYKPPQKFTQGTHMISYTATDQSGNGATCIFAIKVIGRKSAFIVCFARFHDVARHTNNINHPLYFDIISYQLHSFDGKSRWSIAHEQLC